MTLKKCIAGLVAGAMMTSLTGCYSITVQATDIAKPVSVSHSIGRSAKPTAEFRRETVSWWLLGLVGLFTVPGGAIPFMTAPDKVTSKVLEEELRRGGKGVVDLSITTQMDVISWALGTVVAIIPFGGLVRPMSVVVEGKVVD
jgi:hypothetical protein